VKVNSLAAAWRLQTLVARNPDDSFPATATAMANGTASNQFCWLSIQPTCGLTGRCQGLCEASPHRKLLTSLQHMEASASELVGHRFNGHDAVPFGFLPLIKLAASTYAHAKKRLPFLVLPSPFFFPLDTVTLFLGLAEGRTAR